MIEQRGMDAAQLNADGIQALRAGQPERAVMLHRQAVDADPRAPVLWTNLAAAQRAAGDVAGERDSLEQALAIDPLGLTALVRKAELHERIGDVGKAMRAWSAVLQVGGSVPTPDAGLAAVLGHASAYAKAQQARFAATIETDLAPALAGAGDQARRRFDACLGHALGRRRVFRSECSGLHYPFLPADEFFPRAHFPWMAQLEAATPAIRAEAERLLAEGTGIQPYVKQPPGVPANKWTPLDRSLDWGSFFLWRNGRRIDEACARFPAAAAALAEVPMLDLEGRGPTAFFSVLKGGAHIPPHTGVTNVRAIVHLPLVIPEGCRFRVGGTTRPWREGEAFAFDDTIEHEAWNDGAQPRVALLLDVWNPHLSEEERGLIRAFFAAAAANPLNPGVDEEFTI